MEQQTVHRFIWHTIEVELIYTHRRWSVIDHLDIRSVNPERAPLPITRTGYLSHFMQPGTIETHGGDVVARVTAWLNDEATNAEWRAHTHKNRQNDLFDRHTAVI